jgi:hypothetical protein
MMKMRTNEKDAERRVDDFEPNDGGNPLPE